MNKWKQISEYRSEKTITTTKKLKAGNKVIKKEKFSLLLQAPQ